MTKGERDDEEKGYARVGERGDDVASLLVALHDLDLVHVFHVAVIFCRLVVFASSTKFPTECKSMDMSASKLPCRAVCEICFSSSLCASPLTMSSTNLA